MGLVTQLLADFREKAREKREKQEKLESEARKAGYEAETGPYYALAQSDDFKSTDIPLISKGIGSAYDRYYPSPVPKTKGGKNQPPPMTKGEQITAGLGSTMNALFQPIAKAQEVKSTPAPAAGSNIPILQNYRGMSIPDVPDLRTRGERKQESEIAKYEAQTPAVAARDTAIEKGKESVRTEAKTAETTRLNADIKRVRDKYKPGTPEYEYYDALMAGAAPYKDTTATHPKKDVWLVGPKGERVQAVENSYVTGEGRFESEQTGKPIPLPTGWDVVARQPGEDKSGLTGEDKNYRNAIGVVNKAKRGEAVNPDDLETAQGIIQKWKNTQAGAVARIQMDLAQIGPRLDPEKWKTLARTSIITGQEPRIPYRNALDYVDYANAKVEAINELGGPEGAAAKRAEYQAQKGSLATVERIAATNRGTAGGTKKEIDRALALAKDPNVSKYLTRFKTWNQFDQFVTSHTQEAPELARFREAVLSARQRYSSQVANVRGGGAATDTVRHETDSEIINRTMPAGTLRAALEEMKTGLDNMQTGLDEAVKATKGAVRNLESGGPTVPHVPGTKIRVRRKADGRTGTLDPADFNPAIYEKIQ